MAKRFVVDENDILLNGDIIQIFGTEANHIKVLRHKVGDTININDYVVEIESISKEKASGKIVNSVRQNGVPVKYITLVQSYLKSDKMEFVVQKAVELGVSSIQPVISKNTVVKLDEKDSIKKVERLNKIAVEAIGQCGRTDSVNVNSVKKLQDIDFSKFDLVILCYEKAEETLSNIEGKIANSSNIAIVIGPEGGFDEQEVNRISNFENSSTVIFGERILRAETASVYMLSILDYLSKK